MTEQADHTATRYLLGVMSEDERDAFELKILGDPDLSEIVADAEADLLDAYVRGELSDEERRLVQEHLLVTDAQQARLESARALQGRLEPSARRPARWWWALAAAAAVAAIALFTFLPRRNTPREAGTPAVAGTPAPAQTTTAKQAPVPEPVIDRTPEPVVATLVLAAGMTRSEGAPARLKLPPEADTLRIEIGLEPGDDEYGSYRAVVQTVGGKVVEERTGLAANDGRLRIDLPASPFRPGEYEVLVEAVSDGGAEPLGAWPFVIR